jgi:hypothetical protein
MKKVILMLSMLSSAYIAQAQENNGTTAPEEDDKKKIVIKIGGPTGVDVKKGDKSLITKKSKKSNDKISSAIVFDLGLNGLNIGSATNSFNSSNPSGSPLKEGVAGKANSLSVNRWSSRYAALYPFYYSFHLYKKSVNITAGLGFNWYNFKFDNDVTFQNDSLGNPYAKYFQTGTDIDCSKVGVSYLALPVMFQVKPKIGRNKLVFGAGFNIGYNIKSWYTSEDLQNNDYKKTITNSFNPFMYSAVAELGINNRIRLFGNYGLSDVLKSPVGQRSYAFGIRFFGL